MAHPVVKFFYRFKGIRQIAKRILKNKTIYQRFHNGIICFHALEFALFWLKDASCENIDRDIQDKLLELSLDKDHFIDIGANVGIMTLSVALRNPRIHVSAYDPNKFVLKYLKRSIKRNKLGDRVVPLNKAVSNNAGTAFMDFTTSAYSGHLDDKGTEVEVVDFGALLKEYSGKKTLIKMDIEGFEKNLVPQLVKEKNPNHNFVIEIHPKGLNGVSDPDFVLEQLFSNGYTVTDIPGKKISSRADIIDWSNVVCYYERPGK